MLLRLSALGDMPAEEGFGVVLGTALNGLFALALIFMVLFIMNKVHKKSDDITNEEAEKEENDEEENK